MTTNIKIKKIVKNSKMNRFQWKWIFTGNKTCCTIWRPFWFDNNNNNNNNNNKKQCKNNKSPNFVWGLNNNKKRCKNNRSPNLAWGLNKGNKISRGAFRSWNFQNGRRCHGNRERMSKSLTLLISETAKGISTRLGIYIK
jgi:hypothetical protein